MSPRDTNGDSDPAASSPQPPVAARWTARLATAIRGSGWYALIATSAGLAVMLVARLLLGLATPAELYGDALTRVIPVDTFAALLAFFGRNAKHIFFVGLVVTQGWVTVLLLVVIWDRLHARSAARASTLPTRGIVLAGVLWGAITLPYALVSAFGGQSYASYWQSVLGMTVSAALPAAVTSLACVVLIARGASVGDGAASRVPAPSRRKVLQQVGVGLVALAGGIAAWRFIFQGGVGLGGLGASPPQLNTGPVPDHVSPPPVPQYGSWTPVPGQSPEITSVGSFYYVSKNFVNDPAPDQQRWRLALGGKVQTPLTLSYDQLRALPRVDHYQTLECISNEVGGDLMSTASWTGTSLADLLMSAGIQPGASQLIFRCADGYSDSLHLTQALSARALVAYQIDGQPLPQAHGFPARLLVPGLFGMKNGKWLESLEVASGTYDGYWEQRGWTHEAVVKLTARIDVPGDGDVLAMRPTTIAGVAFAGDQGIGQVEVSTDAGRTWSAAALKRPLGDLTWVLWELPWTPTLGSQVLAVRAIDLSGRVQTPHAAPPLPDGASGYHTIAVHVG